MATYSTDLTTLTTAESGSWTEFANPYNGGGSPGLSGENFIQGTDCYAQNSGKANGLEISIVYNHGSGVTYATDEVVLAWCFYAVGTNLNTYANNGWRFGIGQSTSNWSWWRIGGSDYGRNPYGGWVNVAIDPTDPNNLSTDIGSGTGTTYQYYGNVPNTINEITKGDPTAVDAIRTGRAEISMTGTGVTFSELAEYNDYNAGGTPPGTSSTSVDSGRHRLGLFQETGGTYLWKGLMSVGTSASSVTFTDSNETIVIDDCPNTYAGFNKIEFNNASSTVNWTNITFISTSTTTVSDAQIEVVDNGTINLTSCTFNGIGTTILLSNSTLTDCVFNQCGQLTVGSAEITGCTFNESTSASSLVAVAGDITGSGVYGNTFISDGSNHAINLGTISSNPGALSWDNNLSGYAASDGSTGNEAILVNYTDTGSNLVINVVGGDTPSVNNTGAGTVVVQQSVPINVTVVDGDNVAITTANVRVEETDGTLVAQGAADGGTGSNVFSSSYGGTTPLTVRIKVRSSSTGETRYFPVRTGGVIESSTGLNVTITMTVNNIVSA